MGFYRTAFMNYLARKDEFSAQFAILPVKLRLMFEITKAVRLYYSNGEDVLDF